MFHQKVGFFITIFPVGFKPLNFIRRSQRPWHCEFGFRGLRLQRRLCQRESWTWYSIASEVTQERTQIAGVSHLAKKKQQSPSHRSQVLVPRGGNEKQGIQRLAFVKELYAIYALRKKDGLYA